MLWLSAEMVREFIPLAAARGVSTKARSRSGFTAAYLKAGSPERLSEAWIRKRQGFVARHVAQGTAEGWWRNGQPTRRHLSLIMWAYSPTPTRTLKYIESI